MDSETEIFNDTIKRIDNMKKNKYPSYDVCYLGLTLTVDRAIRPISGELLKTRPMEIQMLFKRLADKEYVDVIANIFLGRIRKTSPDEEVKYVLFRYIAEVPIAFRELAHKALVINLNHMIIWEEVNEGIDRILSAAYNVNKYCSRYAQFKQELLKQFQSFVDIPPEKYLPTSV